jgi:hypothetical protein
MYVTRRNEQQVKLKVIIFLLGKIIIIQHKIQIRI